MQREWPWDRCGSVRRHRVRDGSRAITRDADRRPVSSLFQYSPYILLECVFKKPHPTFRYEWSLKYSDNMPGFYIEPGGYPGGIFLPIRTPGGQAQCKKRKGYAPTPLNSLSVSAISISFLSTRKFTVSFSKVPSASLPPAFTPVSTSMPSSMVCTG